MPVKKWKFRCNDCKEYNTRFNKDRNKAINAESQHNSVSGYIYHDSGIIASQSWFNRFLMELNITKPQFLDENERKDLENNPTTDL